VNISFAPSQRDGGAPITSYSIDVYVNGAIVTSGLAASFANTTFSNLKKGTAYTFTVSARNVAGKSMSSLPSNLVTPTSLPSPPQNVTATGIATSTAVISWDPPADNGGLTISSYVVSWANGSQTVTNGTSATFNTLTNGTSYVFNVLSVNSVGRSATAASNAVMTIGLSSAPQNVVATLSGASSIVVTFNKPATNGGAAIRSYTVRSVQTPSYQIVQGENPAAITFSGLSAGSTYTYTVSATNILGESATTTSNAVTIPIPMTVPSSPWSVDATLNSNTKTAVVRFNAPANNGGSAITQYRAYSTGNPTYFTGTSSPISISGVPDIRSAIWVQAKNTTGWSDPAQAESVSVIY
jgi:titin